MLAAASPAAGTPEQSRAARCVNKAPQTDPTARQPLRSPAPGSLATDDPVRSDPPVGYTKIVLPIVAARHAWQITSVVQNDGITISPCRRESFSAACYIPFDRTAGATSARCPRAFTAAFF